MFKIKKEVLEAIMDSAKATYPNEFFSLLGTKKDPELIEELVIVPAIYGKNFTQIQTWLLPFDKQVKGTVHSHPSSNYLPSKTDLASFARLGKIHMIVYYPFNIKNFKAFEVNGKFINIEIIE